jgi:hypothetical protein
MRFFGIAGREMPMDIVSAQAAARIRPWSPDAPRRVAGQSRTIESSGAEAGAIEMNGRLLQSRPWKYQRAALEILIGL